MQNAKCTVRNDADSATPIETDVADSVTRDLPTPITLRKGALALAGTVVALNTSMGYDHLKRRTFKFAVDSINAARPLLGDPLGRLLAGQAVRSGSSVGANYEAACNARSRAGFASKVAIVAEEASETGYWFRLFVALELLEGERVEPIVKEAGELAAIATASAQTARGRRTAPAPQRAESR